MKPAIVIVIAVILFAAGYLVGSSRAPGPPPKAAAEQPSTRGIEARLERSLEENRELERLVTQLRAAAREAGAPDADDPLDAFRETASDESAAASIRALAKAFADGELTKLDLLNLLAEPGREALIAAGLNDRDQPDRFRKVMLEAIENVDDPLSVLVKLDLETEPNQGFSAYLGHLVMDAADRGNDDRAFDVIRRLIAGNAMHGNKVNLYASLAQMAGRGDARSTDAVRAHLAAHGDFFFAASLRVLADPPKTGEEGAPLAGVLLYSIQFNKGKWKDRPRTLAMGEIVTRIGEDPVTDRRTFYSAIDRNKERAKERYVEVRVLIPDPADPTRYSAETREMDPGDFRLMYGAFSIGQKR
jgi:hypothetical protein